MKLEHESIPLEIDVGLQRQIEFILLNEPSIYDYAVQVRRISNSADEITIYFIPLGPINQTELQMRMEALPGKSRHVFHFVPLLKLPREPDDSTDYPKLAWIASKLLKLVESY
jgi:hypothetical protein